MKVTQNIDVCACFTMFIEDKQIQRYFLKYSVESVLKPKIWFTVGESYRSQENFSVLKVGASSSFSGENVENTTEAIIMNSFALTLVSLATFLSIATSTVGAKISYE